jgi:hypothetical protein
MTKGVLTCDITATYELMFYSPTIAGNTVMTIWLLNGEGGSNNRQVVICVSHLKLAFLACITSVSTVVMQCCCNRFEWP